MKEKEPLFLYLYAKCETCGFTYGISFTNGDADEREEARDMVNIESWKHMDKTGHHVEILQKK